MTGPKNTDTGIAERPASGAPREEERKTKNRTGTGGTSAAAAKTQGAKVRVVALVDSSEDGFEAYINYYLERELKVQSRDIRSVVVEVRKWTELPAILRRYSEIDTLVLMFHGSPGAIRVGNTIRSLNLASKDLTAPMPRVTELLFEACNVGDQPSELIAFGTALSATRVVAWNHALVVSPVTVSVPKNVDIEALARQLKPYEPWLLPSHPSVAELAKRPGKVVLYATWFREAEDSTPLPEGLTTAKANALKRTYKPRSTARDVHYTPAQATALTGQDLMVAPPLQRIILDLK